MTPEAQCIAIAKACPHVAFFKSDGLPYWKDRMIPAYDEDRFTHEEFDPINDLNAMHEAEKVLTGFSQRHRYFDELQKVRSRAPELNGRLVVFCECIMATAAERAEAFLRTIGKWEDKR